MCIIYMTGKSIRVTMRNVRKEGRLALEDAGWSVVEGEDRGRGFCTATVSLEEFHRGVPGTSGPRYSMTGAFGHRLRF